jgi:hypothetical protein
MVVAGASDTEADRWQNHLAVPDCCSMVQALFQVGCKLSSVSLLNFLFFFFFFFGLLSLYQEKVGKLDQPIFAFLRLIE